MNILTAIFVGAIYTFGNLAGLYGAYLLHILGMM